MTIISITTRSLLMNNAVTYAHLEVRPIHPARMAVYVAAAVVASTPASTTDDLDAALRSACDTIALSGVWELASVATTARYEVDAIVDEDASVRA